jgi:glycosyltransferase involved in cell wall biosynthesis
VCRVLAGANWCVFPGADAKEVAEAKAALPNDTTIRRQRGRRAAEALEAEKASLGNEIAWVRALESEDARLSALTSENAEL